MNQRNRAGNLPARVFLRGLGKPFVRLALNPPNTNLAFVRLFMSVS